MAAYLDDLFNTCVNEVCQVFEVDPEEAKRRACEALTDFETEECVPKFQDVGDYTTVTGCPSGPGMIIIII